MIIAIWLVLAVCVAGVAVAKQRSFLGWLLIGALLPVVALILVVVLPRAYNARCPYCAEGIDARARICPRCRSRLDEYEALPVEGGAVLGRLKGVLVPGSREGRERR